MTSPSTIDAKIREGLSDGSLAGTWILDGARSTVGLRSKSMWGLVPVKGGFTDVSGEGVVTSEGLVTGSIRLGSASVDTNNKKRDEHLRSADFFNAAKYPDIIFVVDRVNLAGEGATAVGTLKVLDRQRPLEVPVSARASAGDTLELDSEIEIDRRDFDMAWNKLGLMSMKNTITIHAVFTRS